MVSRLSKLHHPNISELVGYCSEHNQHMLLFGFHKNGSLHDFLHLQDEFSTSPLTWNTRVNIALGTAHALELVLPSLITRIIMGTSSIFNSGALIIFPSFPFYCTGIYMKAARHLLFIKASNLRIYC